VNLIKKKCNIIKLYADYKEKLQNDLRL